MINEWFRQDHFFGIRRTTFGNHLRSDQRSDIGSRRITHHQMGKWPQKVNPKYKIMVFKFFRLRIQTRKSIRGLSIKTSHFKFSFRWRHQSIVITRILQLNCLPEWSYLERDERIPITTQNFTTGSIFSSSYEAHTMSPFSTKWAVKRRRFNYWNVFLRSSVPFNLIFLTAHFLCRLLWTCINKTNK